MPAQIKPKSLESKQNSFFLFFFFPFLFLPKADVPHVYVRAWTLCCFHSLIGTPTFWRVLVDGCAEIKTECPFSGRTNSGRVWRKVPESDARSLGAALGLLALAAWIFSKGPSVIQRIWLNENKSSVSPVIEFFQKEAKEEKHLMIFPRTEEKGPLSARPALELFLKPTLGKRLREGLEHILAFPSVIPSWTERIWAFQAHRL